MNIASFQVLFDPNRLRIIELLLAKERAVNDLVAKMAIQQSGVSRHLRILEEAGFVQPRAIGNKRIYALRSERFIELDHWVSQYRQLWIGRSTHSARPSSRNKSSTHKGAEGVRDERAIRARRQQ